LNKQKSQKASLRNIIKTGYLVKKTENQNMESIMHKTSLCTPTDSTAFMSCVSTPHSRSQDKRNYFKKIQRSELEKSKHNAR
jgi:hypothetical protein